MNRRFKLLANPENHRRDCAAIIFELAEFNSRPSSSIESGFIWTARRCARLPCDWTRVQTQFKGRSLDRTHLLLRLPSHGLRHLDPVFLAPLDSAINSL